MERKEPTSKEMEAAWERYQKAKEATKQWKKNNPEKVKDGKRRYREAHREEINQKQRERYHTRKKDFTIAQAKWWQKKIAAMIAAGELEPLEKS